MTRVLEVDLAVQLIETLRPAWDVYQEVRHRSGRIADIVAISKEDGRSHVIECKVHAGLDVVEQASFWRGRATHSSVAVPLPSEARSRAFFCRVCVEFGIGVFHVAERVIQVERPVFDGQAVLELDLLPENLRARAGARHHDDRPSRRRTVSERVIEIVRGHPNGVALAEIIATPGLPFRRDAGGAEALRRAIRRREFPGIELKKRGGEWHAVTTNVLFGRGPS